MRAGGDEDSASYRDEGAGNLDGWVWNGGKGDTMTQGPPCGRRGRGGEEGDFCVEMGVQDGDLVRKGDSSPDWTLCAQVEMKEQSPVPLDPYNSSPASQPFC